MMDRVLRSLLWLTVMGLIASTAGAALYLGYSGMIWLFGGDTVHGAAPLAGSLAFAAAAWLLCKYSDDLIDRY